MEHNKRILAAVPDQVLFQRLAGLLSRSIFEVNRVPSGAGALILIGNLRYDLIVVESPLRDMSLRSFLSAIRTLDSPCSNSAVLVLTKGPLEEQLGESLLREHVEIVPAGTEPSDLQQVTSRLLHVPARAATRLLVEIETVLGEGTSRRVGQSVNLSETGMLLRGASSAEVGSRLHLRFELPGQPREISCAAEVVRHTGKHEEVQGLGVRFQGLSAEDQARLREWVNSSLLDGPDDPDEAVISPPPHGEAPGPA